ncbi:MAG TPA: maltotransferase domain-containing protein, partial [Streptosporangiaceae bacterium]
MIGRVPILDVQPVLDDGKRPAKAVAGETFEVSATIFGEGHDMIAAAAVLVDPAGERSAPVPMHELAPGTDRLGADVTVTSEGLWQFYLDAWRDPVAQWRHDAEIKVPRGQDTELMLADGAVLFERAARALSVPASPAKVAARAALAAVAERLTDPDIPPWDRLAAAADPEIAAILAAYPVRDRLTRSRRYPVIVHRKRALYGAWYEFFPRSQGARIDPLGERDPVSGTLRTAALGLDRVAEMGFDVIYLPPVHPIGFAYRKGRNNTLLAQPSDPGSPWAIGSPAGGHDSIHPDLGTFDDFDAFVARATDLGLEVALDLALNASPDHPWVSKHPEWFTVRADGSIAYAENPPKKYQDIVNVDFYGPGAVPALWEALRDVVLFWCEQGIRAFRVDNPHTKPLPFWRWMIGEVKAAYPDAIFLSEAFTQPRPMYQLAKEGFSQSYTYFTWRNAKAELTDYFTELNTSPVRD